MTDKNKIDISARTALSSSFMSGPMSHNEHGQTRQDTTYAFDDGSPKTAQDVLISVFVVLCSVLAWSCAIFVPAWKILDTSYLFRESSDPSMYDEVKDYFKEHPEYPFTEAIDSTKVMYRINFMIMPFCLSFLFIALKGLVPAHKRKVTLFRRPSIFNFLRYRVAFGLSVIDILLIFGGLAFSGLLVWARMKRSLVRGARKLTYLYVDSKDPLETVSWEGAEIMAKNFGIVAVALLGWFILLPMGRNSIIVEVLGIPREVILKYHRWLGWLMLWMVIIHLVVYVCVWVYANGHELYDPDGNLLRHMLVPRSCKDGSCDDDTNILHIEMMYGLGCLFIIAVMSVTSLNYIRRKNYDLFFNVHQLYRLVVLFLCFHYKSTLMYLIPGIAMIIIDKTIGYISFFFANKANARVISEDVFELRMKKDKALQMQTGQFIFINVPLVSVLAWHPMTVCWATEEEFAVHIKAQGGEEWTQKVYDTIAAGDKTVAVRLDGFYGANQITTNGLQNSEAVAFFAGGVGFSVPYGIIQDLCRENSDIPVYFNWITRTRDEFAAFEGLLLEYKERFPNLSVSVWVTLSKENKEDLEHRPVYKSATSPGARTLAALPPGKDSMRSWFGARSSLWSTPTHALINAIGIFLATAGYALAVENSGGDKLSQEPRYFLINRFLELFFAVGFVFAWILLLIGIRLGWKFMHSKTEQVLEESKYGGPKAELTDSDSEDETPSSNAVEDSPIVVGIRQRPDIEDLFLRLQADHPYNVSVIACGPDAMVEAVKVEAHKRIKYNWTVAEEEWEW